MTNVLIPYGDEQIFLDLPDENLMGVFAPAPVKAVPNLTKEISRALRSPVEGKLLSEMVKPGERVVILVDDHTRSTPTAAILPMVIQQLSNGGLPDRDIQIMFARGTHRSLTQKEVTAKLGPGVKERFQVFQHDCHAEEDMVFVGMTGLGTPVWVNRLVAEADRRIGIGHIGPSPYAGYSGGGKLMVPGVSSIDTINFNHSFVPTVFRRTDRIGETIDLVTRQDLDEAAAMVGLDMVLDVVLGRNEAVVKAFAGPPDAVFGTGLPFARRVHEVQIPAKADIVITSGNPYSIDLYQAMRAVEYADTVVCEGGAIVLVADCPEGIGDPEFYRLMAGGLSAADFLRAITRREMKVTFAALGYCLARIKSEKRIYLLSDHITKKEKAAMGLLQSQDLQRTLLRLLTEYEPGARVAVFSSGAVTIPRITKEVSG